MCMGVVIIHSIIITTIVVAWKRTSKNAPLRWWIVPGVCLKMLAGVVTGLLFLHYYGYSGDSWNMHHSATQLAQIAYKDLGAYLKLLFLNEYYHISQLSYPNMWEQPRYLFAVKLVSIVEVFTQSNYWFTSFYLSLFSFSGLWFLANTLSKLFPATKLAAGFSFLAFPSVLFWSSGLQKESLALGIMSYMLHLFLKALFTDKKLSIGFWLKSGMVWLLTIAGLWQLKFYYLGGLAPVMGSIVLGHWLYKQLLMRGWVKHKIVSFGVFIGVLTSLLLLASFMHPKLKLSQFMHVLVLNHNASFHFSAPDDLIHYTRLQAGYFNLHSSWRSITYNSPLALVSGLFRPFIWEANNKMKLVAGIENLWILSVSIYALIYFLFFQKKRAVTKVKVQDTRLLFACYGVVTYISLLATLLALASPNFGTLVRYKVGFLPFLIYLTHLPLNRQVNVWLAKHTK